MDGEVVVRKYDTPHEAELNANYLRHHDISARVDNDVVIGMNPFLSPALGGIRLHVPDRDAERARELLAELEAGERQAREKRDPTTLADRAASRAFTVAILGTFLVPVLSNLYSFWLAIGVPWSDLSERGKREVVFSVCIDLSVFAMVAMLFLTP